MKQTLIILMLCCLLLTACGGTPTPDLEATVQVAIAATLTALPTNTPTPDVNATVGAAIAATQAAQPTDTPTPTPTETLVPTQAPTLTDTPSPTDTPEPEATYTPEPTATPPLVHVVQEGETLFEIARQYGVSVDTLMAANNITDRSLVRLGQELTIPPSDMVVAEAEPTEINTPTGEVEPELDDLDAIVSGGTSTPTSTELSLTDLPVENKSLIIETALRANKSVAAKGVAFGGEAGKEAIVVVIETQSGAKSIADQTTLVEATTSFIYAYEGNQRLEMGAKFVVVQALDDLGNDIWYAVTSIDDIGLLVDGEITALEFVQRIRVMTP